MRRASVAGAARSLRSIAFGAVAGLMVIVFTGCSTVDRDMDIPVGRAYKPANFTHAGPLPASLRRVAVLPLHSRVWTDEEMGSLEEAMTAELAKLGRFEITPVSRSDMEAMFGVRSVGTTEALPATLFAALSERFGADGVLLVDLTHYKPYQPLAIGVRARLVEIPSGRALWAFDDLFDVSQPSVAVAARRYYQDNSRQTYPLGHTSGILQSPVRFAKYVGSAMFGTLPPRGSS